MPMERLHIMVPKGTIKRAKKQAKIAKLDTHSEYLREIIRVHMDSVDAEGKK